MMLAYIWHLLQYFKSTNGWWILIINVDDDEEEEDDDERTMMIIEDMGMDVKPDDDLKMPGLCQVSAKTSPKMHHSPSLQRPM